MRDPHGYFGHSPLKPMTLINVGGNAVQGKKNFFDPLKDMIRSPKFLEWLIAKGFRPDKEINNNEILMPKNIQLYSGHTGTAGIEGFDVLMGLVDECDDAGFTSAENIFRTLDTSASTRFGPRRKVMTISFRRYVGSSGVLKKLYHEFSRREGRTGTAYARRYATWEFNNRPQLKESLQEYIDTKPEEAACMVESKDDEGYYDSWIKDTVRIKHSMTHREGYNWIFDMPVPDDNWMDIKDAEYAWKDPETGEKIVMTLTIFPSPDVVEKT